jgi:hypothetical protein
MRLYLIALDLIYGQKLIRINNDEKYLMASQFKFEQQEFIFWCYQIVAYKILDGIRDFELKQAARSDTV